MTARFGIRSIFFPRKGAMSTQLAFRHLSKHGAASPSGQLAIVWQSCGGTG